MSKLPKLKACPFCGVKPFLEKMDLHVSDWHRISCENLDCPAMPEIQGATRQEAIAIWNYRPGEDE